MALADFDLTVAGILSHHMPDLGLAANSKPTSTKADEMLDEVLAEVNGILASIGIAASDITSADTVDYPFVRRWVARGFLADLLEAKAGGTTPQSESHREEFLRLTKLVQQKPQVLSDTFSAGSSSGVVKSHVSNLGLSSNATANTDSTPPFQADDNW